MTGLLRIFLSQRRRDAEVCRAEKSLVVIWSAAACRRTPNGGFPPVGGRIQSPFTAQGPAPAVKSGSKLPHSIRAESPIECPISELETWRAGVLARRGGWGQPPSIRHLRNIPKGRATASRLTARAESPTLVCIRPLALFVHTKGNEK